MSKGSTFIDGIDLFDLGCFILKGGDHDLLSFPERKEPLSIDWFEQDGPDVDLSEVYFKEKEVLVRFHLAADSPDAFMYNLDTFYSILSQPGYRLLESRELGKTFTLRCISVDNYDQTHGLSFAGRKHADIDVRFSMDDPLQVFGDNMVPTNHRSFISHVTLNGYDMSEFGITVRDVYSTALRAPAIKQGLVKSFDRSTGVIADVESEPRTQSKDLIIDCVMTASDREMFWVNYEALFNQITQPGAVRVGFIGDRTLSAYYTGMDSFTKFKAFSNGAHVSFKLLLKTVGTGSVFVDEVRITEDGEERITEIGIKRKL